LRRRDGHCSTCATTVQAELGARGCSGEGLQASGGTDCCALVGGGEAGPAGVAAVAEGVDAAAKGKKR
jgi:hypothetical protein